MLQIFYPGMEADSVYQIRFERLYQEGIRGVIFDIDNTLVAHGAPADERSIALFASLRQIGLQTCLISNNQEPRVRPFAEAVGSLYVCDAHKPSVKNYKKAMELMQTEKNTTIFIGDQLFTDVFGANRAGIFSCLVRPIHPKEEIQIVLKRYLERIVLFFYHRRRNRQR
jgi:HAD superfamily phosphatase (TIGR01668 family)